MRKTKPVHGVADDNGCSPDDAALGAFLRGELIGDDAERVAGYLESHPDVWRRLTESGEIPVGDHRAYDDSVDDTGVIVDRLRAANQLRDETRIDISVPLMRLRELLPEYELLEEIGRGGMGIVFRARHINLERDVAIKVLPALLGAVRPDGVTRFRREAAMTAKLKHNNIIAVHDYGEVDGTLYYTMELVEGQSLREVLSEIEETGAIDVVLGRTRSGSSGTQSGSATQPSAIREPSSSPKPQASSLSLTRLDSSGSASRNYYRRIAQWIADVAEALDYAHQQGVIHRDVKPSNLILGDDGRLMITDFGLARSETHPSMTASRAIIGTARYMSPEQVDPARGAVDARTDVYGLGATLYEFLAFRPMFDCDRDHEVLRCVLNTEPAPPRRIVHRVPRELETICLKAVEKERTTRYATAKDMADDLNRWLLDLPIHAKRPSLPARVGKFVRRRKVPTALAASLMIVLLGSGLLYARYVGTYRQADELRSAVDAQGMELLLVELQLDADLGRYKTGLEKVEAALTGDPDHEDLQHARATFLQFLHRSEEAAAYLEGVVTRDPHCWSAHYKLVQLYSELGRVDRAAEHSRVAETLMPPGTANWKVYCLKARCASTTEEAIDLLSKALELEPTAAGPLLSRCARLGKLGRFKEMLHDAERAVAMRPHWSTAYGQRGRALVGLERYEEAIRDLDRAIKLGPQWAAWWGNRAEAHTQLGHHRKAVADAEEALQRDPREARVYAVRAGAYAALGEFDRAFADIDQALSLRADDVELHLRHALVLERAGRHEEMPAVFDRAAELGPGNPKIDFGRGAAFYFVGRYEDAIAAYSRVLERYPMHLKARHFRAVLWTLEQRFEQAVADLTYVLDEEPTNGVARSRRGFAYEMLGAYALAGADHARLSDTDGAIGVYGTLWHYLILRQTGQEQTAAEVLSSRAEGAGAQVWTDRLFALFVDELTPEDLVAAAMTDDERAEAHYYIARKALLDGKPDEAKEAFTKCVALDRNDLLETDFARALLMQMNENDGPHSGAAVELRDAATRP